MQTMQNLSDTQHLSDLQNPEPTPLTQQHWQEDSESDLLGRIVVTAGIFLLLFFAGRFLKEPSQETVQAWVTSDSVYETAVKQTADWIEGKWNSR